MEPSRTEPSPPHRQRSAARLRGPPRTPGGPSRARAVRSRPCSSPALVGGPGPRLSARARREAAVLPREGPRPAGVWGCGLRANAALDGAERQGAPRAGRPCSRVSVFTCLRVRVFTCPCVCVFACSRARTSSLGGAALAVAAGRHPRTDTGGRGLSGPTPAPRLQLGGLSVASGAQGLAGAGRSAGPRSGQGHFRPSLP